MAEELRQLHLLGATGASRVVMEGGREWLVVPTVALMEGVIHPVNAATPEFVSAAVLEKAATSWNGKPITLGHPTRGGKQCSANDPEIYASHGIGEVRNARYENKKVLCESWIDTAKAGKLHPDMLARLRADHREEVSVGAFVFTDDTASEFNGKPYKAAWLETKGDHLAFLPGGRGACSVAMGCGTHRAAMHLVTASAIEPVNLDLPVIVFSALADQSLDERIRAVNDAVYKKWNASSASLQVAAPYGYAYAKQVFDSSVIVERDNKIYAVPYDVADDGTVTLGAETEVRQTYVAAKSQDCVACGGTGQVKAGDHQQDCPTCDGAGKLRAAAGARHSASDVAMIQGVHDHSVALGAECDRQNYKMLGDVAGHEFHGNQHTDDNGSGGDRRSTESTASRKSQKTMLQEDAQRVKEGKAPIHKEALIALYKANVGKRKPTLKENAANDDAPLISAAEPELRAACRCEEGVTTMTKEAKAVLIAALTTDKYSGFKEGDVAFLEQATDVRLEEFKAAADANKAAADAATKNENDLRAAQAKLTVIEGKLKAAEATPTPEQWLAVAPPEIRTLLENQKAQENELREGLIKELKTAGANTEEELKAMPTAQLQTLAKYAKVVAPDFSGRGIPQQRAAAEGDLETYAPPNPYEPGLKALRDRTVN